VAENPRDDLTNTAVAMACWYGENYKPPVDGLRASRFELTRHSPRTATSLHALPKTAALLISKAEQGRLFCARSQNVHIDVASRSGLWQCRNTDCKPSMSPDTRGPDEALEIIR